MSTSAKPEKQAPGSKPSTSATTPAPAATSAARKARKPVDPNESKSDRFRRLARKRLARVLKGMEGLQALGRGQYEYTPEQATKLLQYLVDGVAAVKVSFAPRSAGKAAQELPDL